MQSTASKPRRSPRLLGRTLGAPRRSPRLLGRTLNSQPEVENKQSRKKQRQDSKPARISLLALPDEPLCLIFIHLGATKTEGSFSGPRHAFALAQTNTRLLRLFGSLLTSITPDFENEAPPTLWPDHLLSVTRVAGHALRKLDLPMDSFGDLPMICRACPRLEVLSVMNDPDVETNVLAEVLHLPLQSFSITGPSRDQLDSLVPPPPALSLKEVEYEDVDKLELILRGPLTKLDLAMADRRVTIFDSKVTKLVSYLKTAISNIESVSVHVFGVPYIIAEDFPRVAAEAIDGARANERNSKCMSLLLSGSLLFELISEVHRTAKIEFREGQQSYADDGHGIYARSVNISADPHLLNLGYDFSRLEEVFIPYPFLERWNEVLSGVRLKRVFYYPMNVFGGVSLSFESLEMPVSDVNCRNWSWLGDAHRVRITDKDAFSKVSRVALFESLASLLKQFRGDEVWITYLKPYDMMREGYENRFARAVKAVSIAAKNFEKHGGDAATVRVLADDIITRWRR